MAVIVEAFSVIVRRDAIEQRYRGGHEAFVRSVPNATFCADDHLARVGFMTPPDVKAYVTSLERNGLVFQRDGRAEDLAVVSQVDGPTCEADWLEFGTLKLKEGSVAACWLKNAELTGLAVPDGWSFGRSLQLATPATFDEHFQFLRHENGTDVYLNTLSGQEVYIGRPSVKDGGEASASIELDKLLKEVLALESEADTAKALQDVESGKRIYERLTAELLPKARVIAEGDGKRSWQAFFTVGLVLRVLQKQSEAVKWFAKANELERDNVMTLRELVKCLGETNRPAEALPYAREVVKIAPLDATLWGNLAMCLIQCGERTEARRAIDEAISLDPKDPINRYIRDNFDSYFRK